MDNKIFDPQYLDNHFERYYFIPWPDCQIYDNLDDDENVIPINIQGMTGSFVNAEWIADECNQVTEYDNDEPV